MQALDLDGGFEGLTTNHKKKEKKKLRWSGLHVNMSSLCCGELVCGVSSHPAQHGIDRSFREVGSRTTRDYEWRLGIKKRGGILNTVNRRIAQTCSGNTFSHSYVTWYLYQKESAPEGMMQKAPQVVRWYRLTRQKLSVLFWSFGSTDCHLLSSLLRSCSRLSGPLLSRVHFNREADGCLIVG